jgi:tripartite-type tricarboxylate transporter receptor subunit TctC
VGGRAVAAQDCPTHRPPPPTPPHKGPHKGEGRSNRCTAALVIALLPLLAAVGAAHAQSVESFYRGRTVTIVVGLGVGGGYDTTARVLARHLGRHIPGDPAIVVQSMVGAGSLRAANYLYSVAPKDGATLGVFARGMAMEPLIGASHASFDSRKFAWLGSTTNEVSVCVTYGNAKVKTWDDALRIPFTVGGDGTATDPDIFSAMLKNVFGARLRLVTGYPGGADITLALERGEVEGRCGWTWSSVRLQRPDWIGTGKLNLLVQLATQKSPELPNVPLIMDLATTERQRRIVSVILARQPMGRPVVAPPGIPEDRKQALRRAFDATMADPDFIAEATARSLEVNPVKGADLDRLVDELYAMPPAILAEVRAIIAEGAK